MSLIYIMNLLEKMNIPVAYSHFKQFQTPPYICYLVDGENNFAADNKVYKKVKNINIELYTAIKDLEIESKLEQLLEDNKIFYEAVEDYIESEDVYRKTYEIGVI